VARRRSAPPRAPTAPNTAATGRPARRRSRPKPLISKQTPPRFSPDWVPRHCPEAALAPDLNALHSRAPRSGSACKHLRPPRRSAGCLRNSPPPAGRFAARRFCPAPSNFSPKPTVTKTKSWEQGLLEVLGSRLAASSSNPPVSPRGDAGSTHLRPVRAEKTLQLATLLGSAGQCRRLRRSAPPQLRELQARATRAGLTTIITVLSPPRPPQTYDGVFVDAPCSGSGTWRRAPHLKWDDSRPVKSRAAAEKQLALLHQFLGSRAPRRPPDLRDVFAHAAWKTKMLSPRSSPLTPSLRPSLPRDCSPPRSASVGLAILPSQHNTDGFYVAALLKKTPLALAFTGLNRGRAGNRGQRLGGSRAETRNVWLALGPALVRATGSVAAMTAELTKSRRESSPTGATSRQRGATASSGGHGVEPNEKMDQ